MGETCSHLNADELNPEQREKLKMQGREGAIDGVEEVRGFEL